jgi:hypothetical protein
MAGQAVTEQGFAGGFPVAETIDRVYDESDLNRAIQAYRFFYPTVSGAAVVRGNRAAGLVDNKVFGILDTTPQQVGFTLNSDTPYGPMLLDLSDGPMVVELPPGPLINLAIDVHQRWVADMGLPGPDEGRGGRHLIVPLGYTGDIPDGYHVWHSTTNTVIVGARALPTDGDVQAAMDLVTSITVHPLEPRPGWNEPAWINLTGRPLDMTPLDWETNIQFWEVLHEVIDSEYPYQRYRDYYGELAVLGIARGRPFEPDERMRRILTEAALAGNAQMRVESFADRRPDDVAWPDRKWQWAGLRPENGDFETPGYVDLDARDVWFYQAIGASPAMFRRRPGFGSLYWLGLRDSSGKYLDGGTTYRLTVPLPVPAQLFWSVTVYDAETRSQIQTDQGRAAVRSLFELRDSLDGEQSLDLFFGPEAPPGRLGRTEQWVKTIPGRGWFSYLRLYGPKVAAFDGAWKPADFEVV